MDESQRGREGSGGTGVDEGAPPGRADVITCPNCGARNRVPAAAKGVPSCGNCKAALPWVTSAGDADFDEVVAGSALPVLLDLWAAWCAPCRIVEPGVEEASRTFAGRLKVVKVDVDAAPGVAQRFDARSIPTLLVLDRGREVARQVGAVAPKDLVRWVEEALANKAA